jgi:hypothetical protein
MVPELMQDEIREIIYGDYRLIYRIVSIRQIDIITLHHSAGLPPFSSRKRQDGRK